MLIEQLHQQFPTLTDMRMREIRVDRMERKVSCVLSCPPSVKPDNDTKTSIVEFIRTQIPRGYFCNVKFAEDVFTVSSFARNLSELIKDNYPIYAHINRSQFEISIEGKAINVVLYVDPVTKNNMELSSFCEKLEEHYGDYTSYSVFTARIGRGPDKQS